MNTQFIFIVINPLTARYDRVSFVFGGRTLNKNQDAVVTGEMLMKYFQLNKKKKEIDLEMNQMKQIFHDFFDKKIGDQTKGEITINGYKLQRQIRITEKFNDEETIKRLEDLNMNDLIQIVKKPDALKIKSALNLGFLKEKDLEGCIIKNASSAISVKSVI